MKLIYLNQELDSSKEHELFTENEFGFQVKITYANTKYRNKEFTVQNCTEVHWRFNQLEDWDTEKIAAFESDIHGTGFTRKIADIESVEIENATKLYDEYY